MATTWRRVRLPGVGTWTQADTVPLPDGAIVLDEPAVGADNLPLLDVPESPEPATAEQAEAKPAKPAPPVPAPPAAITQTVKGA